MLMQKTIRAVRRGGRASSQLLWLTGAALAASAVYVQWSKRRAERSSPPTGKFITVDGVRLHYLDTGGQGPAVVFLHGNGSMAKELKMSGIIDALAHKYRVLAFDRPGFGYSERPRGRLWTPAAQSDLLFTALRRKGISSAIVLGHSWGNFVALELALKHPTLVRGLILVAGFYFPAVRLDVPILSIPAIPIFGDIMRYTISPIFAKAIAPSAIRKMFKPKPVSDRFAEQFPIGLTTRPLTLRASAEETAMMIPAAAALQNRYSKIGQPTLIVTGSSDQIVNATDQSVRLHKAIPHSKLAVEKGDGHMVLHQKSSLFKKGVDKITDRSIRKAA